MADNTTGLYIGKLQFRNYNSFKGEYSLDLMDKDGCLHQWSVFLGNNNTGKTNLLKAIASLEPTVNSPLAGETEIIYVPLKKNQPFNANSTPSIQTHFECLIKVDNNHKSDNTFKDKKLVDFKVPQFGYGNKTGYYFADYTPHSSILDLKIYGYGVSRRTGNVTIAEKDETLNAASLFDPEHRLTNIEEWLFQLEFASKNGRIEAEQRLRLIKDLVISDVFPEILDFKFVTTSDFKNYIEYQTKEGWFLFEELGYGYQSTLSWIIDLCKKMFERYPQSENPLKMPAIVLIDELDLHLHPKWQKSIVDYLTKTFTSTQFIVTTHSPLLLQTIENVNLFVLIKQEDKVLIKHIPNNTFEGWSVQEILSEVMELEEGIFSNKHNQLYKEFDKALDNESYTDAKSAFDKLMEILHPQSPERKILRIQLSQIAALNDKA